MSETVLPPLPEGAVALLFTDIEGSTSMLHELGDKYGELLDEHDRILREVWRRHDGVEVDNEGDSFFVAFGDPQSAVAAAVDVQASLARGNWPATVLPRVRMGLHAGRPRVRGRRYWGIDVNYAARLCSAAHGGQALLSAAMRAAVPSAECESLGEHGLKDFGAARPLFHLVANGMHSHDFPPPRTVAGEGSNLPSIVTPIVGRDALIDEVVERVLGPADRAITLVGMGGVGKTRLVVACGQRLEELLPGAAMFVPLAAVSDVAAALGAIASAARAAGQDVERSLIARLRERRTVLILDNVEHLPALAEPVARLLEAVPDLKIVVTSQAPVGIRQETVVRVEPLLVPKDDADATVVAESSAAAMFLGLVAAQNSSFELTDSAARAVAHLCALLDGMPLGLELAAARARVLGVDALERALERDLDALGTGPGDLPARHRGLRAALDWTVSLLSPAERSVFEGLGAFGAAWSFEQAELMFEADEPTVDLWEALTRLGDLSLIVARGDGRFSMPERVRRHARELLGSSGRGFERRRRHAELMADAMDQLGRSLMLDLRRALANTQDAVEETLYAIGWASEHDPEMHRRLVAFSAFPMAQLGRMPLILDDALAMSAAVTGHERVDGFLRLAAGLVHGMGQSDMVAQRGEFELALEVFAEAGTIDDCQLARWNLISSLNYTHDVAEAAALIEDAEREAHRQSDPRWLSLLAGMRAQLEIARGDAAAAQAVLDAMPQDPPDTDFNSSMADTFRADLAFLRNDFAAAEQLYAGMLLTMPRLLFENTLFQIQGAAAAMAGRQRDEEAMELFDGIDDVYRERTGRPLPLVMPEYEPVVAAARARLGDRPRDESPRAQQLSYESLCDRTMALAQAALDQNKNVF